MHCKRKNLPKLFKAIVIKNLKAINIKNANDTIESLLKISVWNFNGLVDAFDNPGKQTIVNRLRQRIATKFGLNLIVTLLHNVTVSSNHSLRQGRRYFIFGDHQHFCKCLGLIFIFDDNFFFLCAKFNIAQMQNRSDRSPNAVHFLHRKSECLEGECRGFIISFLR